MLFSDVHILRPSFGQAVVELNGEHDLETKEMLQKLLTSLIEENDLVVVDVSEAEFIDSSVLHTLLVADELAQQRGSRFRLQLGTAAIVEKALELSGLLDRLEVVPDREQALPRSNPARPRTQTTLEPRTAFLTQTELGERQGSIRSGPGRRGKVVQALELLDAASRHHQNGGRIVPTQHSINSARTTRQQRSLRDWSQRPRQRLRLDLHPDRTFDPGPRYAPRPNDSTRLWELRRCQSDSSPHQPSKTNRKRRERHQAKRRRLTPAPDQRHGAPSVIVRPRNDALLCDRNTRSRTHLAADRPRGPLAKRQPAIITSIYKAAT